MSQKNGPATGKEGGRPSTAPPADLRALRRVLSRVSRRLRLQAGARGAVQGAVAGLVVLLGGTVAHRLGRLPVAQLRLLLALGGALVVLGALAQALRRVRPLDVASRIDRSHDLADRLGNALQFTEPSRRGVPTEARPAEDPTALLRELAIRDAARAAERVEPARAAPWQQPPHLPLLAALCLCIGAAALVRLPSRAAPQKVAEPGPPAPRLYVDPELIAPEREEVARLLAEAERSGDEDLKELAREMQKLLDQVERGELTRKEAFDKLAELEQRLMEGKEGALEELQERLRKAGAELGKDKLAKEAGKALEKEDLEKARKELERLAQLARERQKLSERQGKDRKELAQALRRSADALRDQQEPKDREKPKEEKDQKDEWKDKTDAEKRSAEEQALREEERRLKKKLEENPQDEETARRLKKTQRELERLERQKQERADAQRELERLRRDMEKAAEELERQLQQMTPEQRKALEQLAKDLSRMQDEIRKLQQQSGQGQNGQNGKSGQGQGGMSQARLALGSLKQVLRRVGQSRPGQGGQNGQGQGQGQGQAQNGQGQGKGQGKDGKNGKNPMKDFLDRASGKGGDGDVLVEGEGQGKDGQQVMILGEGNTPLILPGMGQQGPGQGGQGQGKPGMDGIGKDHDPNVLGDPTKLNAKLKNTRVTGKEGAGPTRSETILGSAEKGFAAAPYRKVYQDYTSVAEKVMSKERVPPGYRFYVKRYFQLIKPRE